MPFYMVRLWLEGPIATPMISGTLFGHLCWAYRWRFGEQRFAQWLGEMESQPLLISDAMPRGYLPKPLLRAQPRDPEPLEAASLKALKKQPWLSRDQFLRIRDHLNEDSLLAALTADEQTRERERAARRSEPFPEAIAGMARIPHNTINRLTNRTLQQGGLYFTDEEWPSQAAKEREVYVQTVLDPPLLRDLFTQTGKMGYGRDASAGRGQFSVLDIESAPDGLFDAPGSRRMSLSHGSLTPNMTEARYRLHTHFGKVGGLFSISAKPFKKPLTLLRPGATFRPADDGPFGELLRGVYSVNPRVVHCAWHLTVRYTEKD
jgi:CRISPR-associated protein Csm4